MVGVRLQTDTNVAKFTVKAVPDRPGMAAGIFSELGARGINVELITAAAVAPGRSDVSFVVRMADADHVQEEVDAIGREFGAESVVHDPNIALVSLHMPELVQTPGTAGRMFACLSGRGINIDMISTSMASITCVIAENRVEEAARAIMDEFGRS